MEGKRLFPFGNPWEGIVHFRKSVTFSPLFAYVYVLSYYWYLLFSKHTLNSTFKDPDYKKLAKVNFWTIFTAWFGQNWEHSNLTKTKKNCPFLKELFSFGSQYQNGGYRVSASPSSLNCKLLPMASCAQHFIFICPELSTLRILEHMNSIPQLNTNNEAGMVKNMRKSHRAWCRLNLATTKSELSGV